MATRFALHNGPAVEVNPGFSTSWTTQASGAVPRSLSTARLGTTLASAAYAETQAAAANVGARVYVSEPLAAQTISGTISAAIRALESAAAADASLQIVCRVVSADGATTRAHLYLGHTAALNTTAGALGQEIATAAQTRIFNAVPLTSYACARGDRVTVEIGWRAHNTVTTSYSATLRFGDPAGVADFPLNAGGTADSTPWAEFSQDLAYTTSEGSTAGATTYAGSAAGSHQPAGSAFGTRAHAGFGVGVTSPQGSTAGATTRTSATTGARLTSGVSVGSTARTANAAGARASTGATTGPGRAAPAGR